MFFLLSAIAVIQAVTVGVVWWAYVRHRRCVPAKDYADLADSYLDAMLELAKSNPMCNFSDEVEH